MINLILFSFLDKFFDKINNFLKIGERFRSVIKWMQHHLDFLFNFVKESLNFLVESLQDILLFIPNFVLLILFGMLALYLCGRKVAIITTLGLLLILTMGYWDKMIITLSMVLISTIIALLVGIPLGIYSAKNDRVNQIVRPILDFMQTMPAYVYLIPAVLFFGLGIVPGIIATIIFSMPPAVRLTNLGIRQVSGDVVEAAKSFGTTERQLLFKVQLPLAKPTILAGLNQTIMLSLSMVVISAMIGAKGLGLEVYNGITQLDIGKGFESGLSIVILAMVLDRLTNSLGSKKN